MKLSNSLRERIRYAAEWWGERAEDAKELGVLAIGWIFAAREQPHTAEAASAVFGFTGMLAGLVILGVIFFKTIVR
jgi:hypothetical protein